MRLFIPLLCLLPTIVVLAAEDEEDDVKWSNVWTFSAENGLDLEDLALELSFVNEGLVIPAADDEDESAVYSFKREELPEINEKAHPHVRKGFDFK